jgi:aryl-alcohol dehydrogenase-like predicted oxidoreductase
MLKGLFGKSGQTVSRVGLGGEGVLRTHGRTPQAQAVIQTALDRGITYFDSARAYAGSENYYGTLWPAIPEVRANIFQTSKSAGRSKKEAWQDLQQTLSNLGISNLDLWQIHDVRTEEDLAAIESPGGAMEAFLEAKARGLTRFIGVTGHHDPRILTRAVENWPVDAVLMPVNPVEGSLGGFLDLTLEAANRKGIAVIGMKVLGAGYYLQPELKVNAEVLIRYALSQNITLAIVGCSTPDEVETLAGVGRDFEPLSPQDQKNLIHRFAPYGRQLAFYRGVI